MAIVGTDIWAAVAEGGVDEVLEAVAIACRDRADINEEGENEEACRKWRVRGNGVMQALRFYQGFVKARNAA